MLGWTLGAAVAATAQGRSPLVHSAEGPDDAAVAGFAALAAQADLVETMARFDPKLVKMAPAGERPED